MSVKKKFSIRRRAGKAEATGIQREVKTESHSVCIKKIIIKKFEKDYYQFYNEHGSSKCC